MHDIHIVTEECVTVTTSNEEDYNEGNCSSNLAIAFFTTSYARLRLLDMMRKLSDRVLYTDTDSVIYISRPGDWEPELGTILGDWDNQLEAGESRIVSFVSLGPKTYSYQTDTGRQELKVKSITQNGYTENIRERNGETLSRTDKTLNKATLHELLLQPDSNIQVTYPKQLKKNSTTQAITEVEISKTLRLVYDKRILFGDFSTLAYGTRSAIRFGDDEKKFGVLSNMFPCDVVYEGKKFNSAESLFQWQKIPDVKNLQTMAARNEIQYAKTPFLSFAAGRNRLNVRKDWAEVRDNVMKGHLAQVQPETGPRREPAGNR